MNLAARAAAWLDRRADARDRAGNRARFDAWTSEHAVEDRLAARVLTLEQQLRDQADQIIADVWDEIGDVFVPHQIQDALDDVAHRYGVDR